MMQRNLKQMTSFASALLVAGILTSCGDSKSEQTDHAPEEVAREPIRVRVAEVRLEPFSETLLLTGYVKSVDDVLLSTEEGGTLRSWEKERGAAVSRGEILAVMNDDVLRPMYETAKAQFEIAELTFQKQLNVLREQGISEVTVKTTEYSRDAARAQMELAFNRLERTRIKSPIDGILDDRLLDEGELAPPGSPVARVVNLDRMKVIVNVPESQVGIVRRGAAVEVSLSAFPGEVFPGKVSFVGSAVVADNRTVPIEIAVPNTGRRLKPDMIARVQLISSGERQAFLVPQELIQRLDQNSSVVYLEKGGRAEQRTITTGVRAGEKIQVVDGLREGERLIVSGSDDLYDGIEIDVLSDENTPPGENR
ncbi:MAG: efflux RND transporter periplasmic adaptor subunit [Ignavibacteria bacterium]|nr:efflux RND transporter periplasmic adaptor subunit [Ignavibacteria bacterium]